jgi:tRNA wybutosine-synthesizing protein 2
MKYKKIGHVLVINNEVKHPEKFLEMQGIETVVKMGFINGNKREPDVKVLAGSQTETIHKENGCLFKLDVSSVMWSKGNTIERMRIAGLVEEGETVVDMFAGIGYFSIPLAVHSPLRELYSVEINPVAYGYLNENVVLNKVENKVQTILGDCSELAPQGVADRVLMGYVGTTHYYLSTAMECLNDGGIIHYHETVPDKIKFQRPVDRIKKAAGDREVEVINQRIIKKYSPGVSHVVIDAKIE